MSKYLVKSNLKHDGVDYVKGDTVEIEGEAAEVLLRDRIIADPNESSEDDEEGTSPQPAVNDVSREGENVEGDQKVEPGKTNSSQPGDEEDDDAGEEEDDNL